MNGRLQQSICNRQWLERNMRYFIILQGMFKLQSCNQSHFNWLKRYLKFQRLLQFKRSAVLFIKLNGIQDVVLSVIGSL